MKAPRLTIFRLVCDSANLRHLCARNKSMIVKKKMRSRMMRVQLTCELWSVGIQIDQVKALKFTLKLTLTNSSSRHIPIRGNHKSWAGFHGGSSLSFRRVFEKLCLSFHLEVLKCSRKLHEIYLSHQACRI